MKDIKTAIDAQLAVAEEIKSDFITLTVTEGKRILKLLKEQDNETKRILKIIWETLHEGLSIDTVPDQDWVYELMRHRIEDG